MTRTPYYSSALLGMMGLFLAIVDSQKEAIAYWQVPTIVISEADEPSIIQSTKDSIIDDLIYVRKTKDGTPIHYYKKVKGQVCFDEKCRLLDIEIYWNITGRYLGFELPTGEYLSKTDHEPFSDEEYRRLHSLLADESLPLDKTTFEALLEPVPKLGEDVDGYSGATSKSLAAMVVKGAAYTTYKLWNIVNGSTMDIVPTLTEQQLTPAILYRILQSRDITDKIWALNRLDKALELTPPLESILLKIISSDDFTLSYNGIRAIHSNHLRSAKFQNALFDIYQGANHTIKNEILKKLMEAPFLSSGVISLSRTLLPDLNGQQLKAFLQLYTQYEINDAVTQTAVAQILKNKNKFVSNIAYNFLREQETNARTIKLLRDYEENN